ncbi:hypothetical protein QMK56_22860 [Pseudomonas protegens]|uniref:hypothetical protein n=1 Tax=Pseudomonas protegens TaxID=380021 RepID=UPI002A3690D1|nr:hypothetical protein [Pseudomonas protegens]MDX9684330.1 hypothetical protein [Pseudomonas protegens]
MMVDSVSVGSPEPWPNNKLMLEAVYEWIDRLDSYPGWREWNRKKFDRALFDDEWLSDEGREPLDDFNFSAAVNEQYAVVYQYLGLHQTIHALRDCEYYFRRYPFRGLPVSHSDHITNVCEMYFGRFYEFRERLKNYLRALDASLPSHQVEVGKYIKLFDKEFDQEIRARNSVHHHQRFTDQSIDRIFLTHTLSRVPTGIGWKEERERAYRKVTREWVARVRSRAAKIEEFLEATSAFALSHCGFLSPHSDEATNTRPELADGL